MSAHHCAGTTDARDARNSPLGVTNTSKSSHPPEFARLSHLDFFVVPLCMYGLPSDE